MRHQKLFLTFCVAWACFGNPAQSAVPTTLYSFCADNSCQNAGFDYPQGAASLVQDANGDLYGTTWGGGTHGYGSVFKITATGTLTTLHNFCADGGCLDGSHPYFGLALARDGNLYGITDDGGAFGAGTAFRITPGGTLTTLHKFLQR